MDQKCASFSRQDSDETFDEIFGIYKPKCNESRLKSSESSIRRPYSFSLNKNEVRGVFNPEKKDKNEKYSRGSSIQKSMMSGFDIYSSEQKIQKPKRSKSKESKKGEIFEKISPPLNRFPRRPEVFRIEDYQKYMEELDNQAQHMAKIDQSYRRISNDGPEKNYNFQASEQKSEVEGSNFGVNKSRKRAPMIEKVEEKPALLRPVGVIFGAKQKGHKLKTQEIKQNRPESNFKNPPLKPHDHQIKDLMNQNDNKKAIICFYCGGPHYANRCTSQTGDNLSQKQIKCFNCKKQGHTAKFCPQKWCCTKCNSTQHFAKDCPLTSFLPKICNNCFQQGHDTRQCAEKRRCFLCHQQGHQRKDCPKNKQNLIPKQEQKTSISIQCYNCKKIGHYANQCRKPLICHKCGITGHYARDCPHITGSLSFYNPIKSSNFPQNNQNQNFSNKWASSSLPNTQKTKIELEGISEKQNLQPNIEKVEKKKRISRPDVRKQQKDIQI